MEINQVPDKKSGWRNWSFRIKLGIVLVILANLFMVSILLVPFLEVSLATKGSVSLTLFIIAEVHFYTGLFFLGKEMVQKYQKYLNPLKWFKKKENKN